MPLAGLVFRLIKGTPLTSVEGDSNLSKIRDFCNSLEQLFGVVLRTNGRLKDNAVNTTATIADGIVTNAKLAADARIPAGMLAPYAGNSSPPSGWLACAGATVSRTTYADLFTAIGTTYGAGDGSTTFHLPDMRGRSAVGVGTGSGLSHAWTLGEKYGVESVTLTGRESGVQEHSHAAWSGATAWLGAGAYVGDGDNAEISPADGQLVTGNAGHTAAIDAHQNIQPSMGLNYIIKT